MWLHARQQVAAGRAGASRWHFQVQFPPRTQWMRSPALYQALHSGSDRAPPLRMPAGDPWARPRSAQFRKLCGAGPPASRAAWCAPGANHRLRLRTASMARLLPSPVVQCSLQASLTQLPHSCLRYPLPPLPSALAAPPKAHDICTIMYTSGTTGTPKARKRCSRAGRGRRIKGRQAT